MKKLSSIILVILFFSSHIVSQTISINEFMSSNKTIITDQDGIFSDWIEIYNNSSTVQNLLGYSLSDESSNLNKWIFPNVEIQAKSFLLIFASGKNILNINELHTNFKIKQSGEKIFLTNPSGQIINVIEPVALLDDQSIGSIPDGSIEYSITVPSPNQSNINYNSIEPSHTSGFYQSDFLLHLTSSGDFDQIRYTINGKSPNTTSPLFNSFLHIKSNHSAPNLISNIPTTPLSGEDQLKEYKWQKPNTIYKANIIRYASFKDDVLNSPIYSKTYFIDTGISKRYTFPIISIITDNFSLFDYNKGIYIPGKRHDDEGWNWWPAGNYLHRGKEWEKEVHVTYFENDGTLGFETDAGMRMRGYSSTSYPQKSFGIYFRKAYEKSEIKYPIFNNNKTDTFKRLIFRNGGNDFLGTHFKDAMLQEILTPLDLELQNFQPSVVFINGEYWGIHNIRQKYDKYYFKYHFGISEDNINILGNCGQVEEGSNLAYLGLLDFVENSDLTLQENYSHVSNKVDIKNFIDFQIAEIYFANYDWPCNNYKIWKTNNPSDKWRFLIYDLDLSFNFDERSQYHKESLTHATSTENDWPHCECSNLLFRKLLTNDHFKNKFIERFTFLLNHTFQSENFLYHIQKFENTFSPEIAEHIARWSYPADYSTWQSNIQKLMLFAKKRPCFMKSHLLAFFNLESIDSPCLDATKLTNELILAPNPNSGIFYLYNNSAEINNTTISIYNNLGQIISIEKNITLKADGLKYLDLRNLPNNIYYLLITSKNYTKQFSITLI